jgi:hypothetical protein
MSDRRITETVGKSKPIPERIAKETKAFQHGSLAAAAQ